MRIRTVDITDAVAEVLGRSTWKGPVLILPPGQLDRKLYEAVDKVIKALGGKWSRGMGGHLFPTSEAAAELQKALESGSIVDQKKTLEQFFTPPELATRMAIEAGVGNHSRILEPSAGSGRLIDAAMALGHGIVVLACEKDSALASKLGRSGVAYHCGDFMEYEPQDIEGNPYPIDVVLMNPPFSANQDIAHIKRAFDFLRPGGRLAAISSSHWTFATDQASREFRHWTGLSFVLGIPAGGMGWAGPADKADPIESIHVEKLPEGTFKESGTGVGALLILIEKAA